VNVVNELKVSFHFVVLEWIFIDFPQKTLFLLDDFLHVVHFRSDFLVDAAELGTSASEVLLGIEGVYCKVFETPEISTVTKLPFRSRIEISSLVVFHLVKLLFSDEDARVVVVDVMIDDEKKFVFGVGGDLIAPLWAGREGRKLIVALFKVGFTWEFLGKIFESFRLRHFLEMLLDDLALVEHFLEQFFDAGAADLLKDIDFCWFFYD
jgi:hypothetical protein